MQSLTKEKADFAAKHSDFLKTKAGQRKQWYKKGKLFIQITEQTEHRVRLRYPSFQPGGQPLPGSCEEQFWPQPHQRRRLWSHRSLNRRVLCTECLVGWCDSPGCDTKFILSAWELVKYTSSGGSVGSVVFQHPLIIYDDYYINSLDLQINFIKMRYLFCPSAEHSPSQEWKAY